MGAVAAGGPLPAPLAFFPAEEVELPEEQQACRPRAVRSSQTVSVRIVATDSYPFGLS